jgi:hypothetical protein
MIRIICVHFGDLATSRGMGDGVPRLNTLLNDHLFGTTSKNFSNSSNDLNQLLVGKLRVFGLLMRIGTIWYGAFQISLTKGLASGQLRSRKKVWFI